uniref:SRCR domain-containing protein n=1 Tax=Latimeria chalumnae TaxID=7897 RepID=H2ZUK7_LATCH
RLSNGSNYCLGRVEVYLNSIWGTVSGESWDINDANVVCRSRGCGFAIAALTNSYFGEGTGPVWFKDVGCTGNEYGLQSCPLTIISTNNISHSNDAGVICSSGNFLISGNLKVRLVNGSSPCNGRVEVYDAVQWGSVCGPNWDMSSARVICRELNCGIPLKTHSNAFFGRGNREQNLVNFMCHGWENSLANCTSNRYIAPNCTHAEDFSVICSGISLKSNLKVRLVNGSSPCNGRVEVYDGIQWGSVCGPSWDMNSARVICRELKCGIPRETYTSFFFGKGTGDRVFDNLKCYGWELHLSSCTNNPNRAPNCTRTEDFSVICSERKDILKIGDTEKRERIRFW